jgi:hypothetical protein
VGGFIVLEDGRAWAGANWAYDAVLRAIGASLADTGSVELARWLELRTCRHLGPGLGSVDLREVAPANRLLFRSAARQAFRRETLAGPAGWGDPSFYPPWLQQFRVLLRLIKSVDRREPPEAFNPHMTGLVPATGERTGPGWT